jgi:hypothetical protein
MIVLNQSTYSSSSTLNSLADSIGLSISEAQIYSVSVKQTTPGSSNFSSAYGVEFNVVSGVGTNDAYISFADINNSSTYDSGWSCPVSAGTECLTKTTLPKGYTISSLCEIPASGGENCNVKRADVSFYRPNTDARIVYYDNTNTPVSFSNTKGLRITLTPPTGHSVSVVVYNTGQVSIQ